MTLIDKVHTKYENENNNNTTIPSSKITIEKDSENVNKQDEINQELMNELKDENHKEKLSETLPLKNTYISLEELQKNKISQNGMYRYIYFQGFNNKKQFFF